MRKRGFFPIEGVHIYKSVHRRCFGKEADGASATRKSEKARAAFQMLHGAHSGLNDLIKE